MNYLITKLLLIESLQREYKIKNLFQILLLKLAVENLLYKKFLEISFIWTNFQMLFALEIKVESILIPCVADCLEFSLILGQTCQDLSLFFTYFAFMLHLDSTICWQDNRHLRSFLAQYGALENRWGYKNIDYHSRVLSVFTWNILSWLFFSFKTMFGYSLLWNSKFYSLNGK